jgi:muramidase (phage lysozyme)
MPTPTYTPLATVTLGTAASSVTFSSIPATYRDLILVYNFLGSTSAFTNFIVNSDTTANKARVRMIGGPSTSTFSDSSSTDGDFYTGPLNTTSPTSGIYQLMDYSATDKHKTFLGRWGEFQSGDQVVNAYAYRWPSTSAITSINCRTSSGNFAIGATFNLYGVIA